MGAHTTSDDPTRYRLTEDLQHWKLKDPIERVKAYLSRNGLADEDFFAAVEAEADGSRRTCARAAWRCPTRARSTSSTRSTPRRHPELAEQQASVRRVPRLLRGPPRRGTR